MYITVKTLIRSHMGNPTATLDLALSALEGQSQGHSDFKALFPSMS